MLSPEGEAYWRTVREQEYFEPPKQAAKQMEHQCKAIDIATAFQERFDLRDTKLLSIACKVIDEYNLQDVLETYLECITDEERKIKYPNSILILYVFHLPGIG